MRGYALTGRLPPIARIEMQESYDENKGRACILQCIPLRCALSNALVELARVLEVENSLLMPAPAMTYNCHARLLEYSISSYLHL